MLNDIWEGHCVIWESHAILEKQKQKRSNPKVRSLPVYREILGEIPPFLVADATAAGSASWCPLSLRLLHETCETGPPAPEPRSPSSRCLRSLTSLEFAASLSFCCSLFRLTAWAASIVCRVQLDGSLIFRSCLCPIMSSLSVLKMYRVQGIMGRVFFFSGVSSQEFPINKEKQIHNSKRLRVLVPTCRHSGHYWNELVIDEIRNVHM
jgi:hypothetical protein